MNNFNYGNNSPFKTESESKMLSQNVQTRKGTRKIMNEDD
jgi:hypothetical protein